MSNRTQLLADLQAVLRKLETDLLERSEEMVSVKEVLRGEHQRARTADRTAQSYEDWRSDYITQIAAAWVLSCVFVRFLEDNRLIDPPKISGPDERLARARDEHELYFRAHPTETDREYLLHVFDELARLPGAKDIFGEHNPIHELPNWLSGDTAAELLRFFQKIDANTGVLVHDFTDPDWNTRFLGDLYQDLSEEARKKFALLQTPEFVEEFILERTLDPAIEEFGLKGFRMFDPACGSGHFLLGSFGRLLDRWLQKEPGTNVRALVQRSLDSVYAVDVNPYAVAIARFRLLLAAIKACEIRRLADAPAFHLNLACGDSLIHGSGRAVQKYLGDWDPIEHVYQNEDLPALRHILQLSRYHAVVGNPPYVTPKDDALKTAYRERYTSCYKQYSLAAPFVQRIFNLAVDGGFTGQITANSFMKRDFGKKLIEEFLPRVDLTHIVDTSLAYIPGHGTPTVILFGRNRHPVAPTVRTVMGISREDREPSNPAKGVYWTAILQQIDSPGSESRYVSVNDVDRDVFTRHPWTIVGGGASELFSFLSDTGVTNLGSKAAAIGRVGHTGSDEPFVAPAKAFRRKGVSPSHIAEFVEGEFLRDWQLTRVSGLLFPYGEDFRPVKESTEEPWFRWLWQYRDQLWDRREPNGTHREIGKTWYELSRFHPERFVGHGIAFAFVATHNQFVLLPGQQFCKQSAPVIKLKQGILYKDCLALLALLNSSVGGFWMKQVFHDKGGGGIGGGIAAESWERFKEFDGTKIKQFPIPNASPVLLASRMWELADALRRFLPENAVSVALDATERQNINYFVGQWHNIRHGMIALQEELDWYCYHLYNLIESDLTYGDAPPPIQLGQRAFEIAIVRKITAGELETAWFERHGSTPITEIPTEWPEDYRRLIERRIELIETDRNIGLIEQPEYKRRWNTEPWELQAERALRSWLLDRLESYFDFDGRMNDDGNPTAAIDIALVSTARLADVARQDADFMQVGNLYRDNTAFDVNRLVAELVETESVPLLPVLRYKPSGLRKRAEWEQTWDLQRQEDTIDARTKLPKDDPQYLTELQAQDLKRREIGDIPVPPKYTGSDFQNSTYWRLRGKLDVPKERWVSFPHCEGADGMLVIAWAGYDHMQLARAISTYYVDIQERLGGRDDPRLMPLLACLIELIPWLKQWHNEVDPEFGMQMGDYFEGFIQEEARQMGKTFDQIRAWEPPKKTTRRRKQAAMES